MRAHELEVLQEEAHAAYHQGEYSTTINVLEKVIEVTVSTGTELNAAKGGVLYPLAISYKKIKCEKEGLCALFFQDFPLGSRVAGASCGMLHPDGGPAEGHPGSDADHKAAQRQPCRLSKAKHAALQPRRAPRVAQVSWNIVALVFPVPK